MSFLGIVHQSIYKLLNCRRSDHTGLYINILNKNFKGAMSGDSNNFRRPRSNNWGKPQRTNHRGRPSGLRGAQIGLYYKGLSMKKKKQEIVINLKIPHSIITVVENDLLYIRKIAAGQNITLPKIKPIEAIKDQTFCDKNVTVTENMLNSPGPSSAENFIPIQLDNSEDFDPEHDPKLKPLRKISNFKYGYEDIITGSFDEKLDECISKGIGINSKNDEVTNLNAAFYIDYHDMLERSNYKKMLKFRQQLPAYLKAKELINIINDNQVIVISGETGCGKSTQVPQIILDDAIRANKGANVKILVTQPRRIAASSLAIRVAKERGEPLGHSVGYAVRLEKVEERARGSIQYCTTGILLADLEVNQGLTNFSHIILDEVHERDVHVDLSMCMLQKVLKKRKDLKLILMSATLDAENLSAYFDNCPLMHIEGLAYPVHDIYLEDILDLTKFTLPPEKKKMAQPKWMKYRKKNGSDAMEKDIQYRAEIGKWLESKKSKISLQTYKTLQESRIEELNLELLVELLIHICKGNPGAILIFLPGIGDITKLMRIMDDTNCFPSSKYEIYPLHSRLPTLEQHKIFERPPEHIRKIIIATNIAETSITIDDVVYVVDSAKIKVKGLNVERNLSTLQTEWVSQANLRQRRGRAGRCQAGICYHLITSFRAGKLDERSLPELQRSDLLEPVLMIKRLRLGLAENALKLVPSPPAESTIQLAVQHLQKCGALSLSESLTPLGWHMARLPVHPAAGKLLVLGALAGVLDRAASLAAVWGFKEPFQMVIGKEYEVDMVKRDFAMGEPSDHVAASEAIIRWEMCPQREKRSYAYKNFLSNNTLELLVDMKRQFGNNLRQMGFLKSDNVRSRWENRNADNLSLFKAIVAASLYPNIASVKWVNLNNIRKPQRISAYTPEDGRLVIHPSSVMAPPKMGQNRGKGPVPTRLCNNPGANWLVYWLKQRSSDLFILDVTLIYTLPLLFFGEFQISDDVDNPDDCYMSILNIKVRCKRVHADKLVELRSLLDEVLATKVNESNAPSTQTREFEETILKRGRAGRCQAGICYHLITSFRAGKLDERSLPELQRSDLLEPVLMIKRLRLGLAENALKLVPSPPAESTIQLAVQHLQKCGALSPSESLTPLGWHMARLPVHPAAGKLLVLGALAGVLDRAASLAAVWGFKEPFQMVIGKEYEVDMVKRDFAMGEPSDHVAASEAIIRWEMCPQREKRSYAYKNFLSNNTLELLVDMKRQFGNNLRQMGFLKSDNVRSRWENRNADNLSLFKAIVAASLYPNIASVKWVNLNNIRKPQRISAYTPEDGRLVIHPSSVMAPPKMGQNRGKGPVPTRLCNNPGANWLVYWLKQRSSDLFILDVTLIYTLPLLFFGEFQISDDVDNPDDCFMSILNIKVRCKRVHADKLVELRSLLDEVLATKVNESNAPSTQTREFEETILNTVIKLITAEDEQTEYLGGDYTDSDNSGSEDRY